ncbi:MAG TPA: penicillin-binding transpeptidase domain-containing protein, partial [Longimicrobiales bacterium]|nr:penicillin-binding transpeptidase domain-containing protein [Longimicrobiales bacterium]
MNPAEGAMLAAIPRLPRYYNPFRQPENALRRRNLVLRQMAQQGFLGSESAERWQAWPLPEPGAETSQGLAPYFEEWVRRMLDDRFGSQLYTAGLRIYTTLDVDMQRAAQEAMEWGWARIEARPGFEHPLYEEFADRDEPFESGLTPYLQGMFVALDPATGDIRAMVGGRDFDHSKFNRATQARRQAGSAFKPFVYTAAVASGIPASHVLVDAPVVMEQLDGTEWRPQNFTEEFLGPMTIRAGLRSSINMIAIKLGLEVGLETVAQTARRMGIRTEIERFPSTAIGAAEVVPLQMVEAYSAFGTLGTTVRAHPVVRVESAQGEVLWEPQPERTQVLDSLVARIMVSMLSDVVNAGTGYNAVRVASGIPPEVPAAGKTGTTNESTNVWFLGFTPNLVAGVWFGMDQPQTIRPGATGGGDAAPAWGRFMRTVYFGDLEPGEVLAAPRGSLATVARTDTIVDGDTVTIRVPLLPIPDPWPMLPGLVTRQVDSKTGLLASRWCPAERRYQEIYIPGTEPTEVCDLSGPSIFGGLQ